MALGVVVAAGAACGERRLSCEREPVIGLPLPPPLSLSLCLCCCAEIGDDAG